jgi:RNA polymerase sigma-70 factor, ECF subfamily
LSADRRDQIEALFNRYGPGVGRFVLARTGDPELAEELTARVFLKVVDRFWQCRRSPAGWLWAVVRSELVRHFRDRRPAADLAGADPPDDRDGPAGRLERRESQEQMARALERLTDEQQQVVYLKFFQGLGNIEIAQATGLTAANVGVIAHRAVRQLRKLLHETLSSADGKGP